MVISAEPHPPPPPDPVADGAAAVEAAASSARHQAAVLSSFPSLKTWGSHRVLRCAHVNRAGDAIAAARRSPEQLDGVKERLLLHLREVDGSDVVADAEVAAAVAAPAPAAAASRPWKLRSRRRPAVAPASSASPPPERRAARARAEALDRARFSVTLTSEEIEEDVYAVTGARPRRRPRRRPRPVQKQLDGPIRNFVKIHVPSCYFPVHGCPRSPSSPTGCPTIVPRGTHLSEELRMVDTYLITGGPGRGRGPGQVCSASRTMKGKIHNVNEHHSFLSPWNYLEPGEVELDALRCRQLSCSSDCAPRPRSSSSRSIYYNYQHLQAQMFFLHGQDRLGGTGICKD
ncbi:hypothetical protein [Oryza sativa Japonica Group]|uniref:Uncharacterized protein n=1 Tax=Oryza sativa subsp. japonica TaxID=39947 RepID=Q9LGA7_ORYSJ|nr:hypothetical protein [Oryza sativa Japonica Group]BAB64608.1 hypothetical protein [Oryza sativa Japonica Group]